MKKNNFGITVSCWNNELVVGIDQKGKPFQRKAKQDAYGNAHFTLAGESWYEKDFLTVKPQLPRYGHEREGVHQEHSAGNGMGWRTGAALYQGSTQRRKLPEDL